VLAKWVKGATLAGSSARALAGVWGQSPQGFNLLK